MWRYLYPLGDEDAGFRQIKVSGTGTVHGRELTEEERQALDELEKRRVPLGFASTESAPRPRRHRSRTE